MVHTDESVPGLRPYSWDTAGHCILGDPGVGFRTNGSTAHEYGLRQFTTRYFSFVVFVSLSLVCVW